MFQSQDRGAGAASNLPPANATALSPRPERVRHLVYGSLAGIDRTIKLLHRLGYAEPNDWSPPLPVVPPPLNRGEAEATPTDAPWMVILTKTLLLE